MALYAVVEKSPFFTKLIFFFQILQHGSGSVIGVAGGNKHSGGVHPGNQGNQHHINSLPDMATRHCHDNLHNNQQIQQPDNRAWPITHKEIEVQVITLIIKSHILVD